MELKDIRIRVTREKLLLTFSQEQIMEYYFGDTVTIKRKYTNPFRDDKTPGCNFFYSEYGILFFRDFKLGQSLDCFNVAELRIGMKPTYAQVYNQMLGLSTYDLPATKLKFDPAIHIEKETIIRVEVMPFDANDLAYWGQYNIGLDTLKKFNVRRVNKAWIFSKLQYINLPTDPCYRYLEGDKIKLYRPFSKKHKFKNNYKQELEGTSVLPLTGDLLIITKAMKDVMMFSTIGILAVCPRSETALISESIMIDLFQMFKRIVIWFDSDVVGLERSLFMYEKYKENGLVRITHDGKLGKDTSDIVKEHGINKLIELCKQSEIL